VTTDALAALTDIASIPAPDLADPAIAEFADQFAFDVASIDDRQRSAFFHAAGADAFTIAQQIYVHDMVPRLRSVLKAVADIELPTPESESSEDTWARLELFMAAVARLDALDPTLTEFVRLRGARLHDCAVCKSRRSVAAIEAGASDDDFAAIDDWPKSNLPDRTKAALGLVDALVLTPRDVPNTTRQAAQDHLSETEIIEVLLDVVRNAANKIAVALDADAATVTEGVELFTTDTDGNVIVAGVLA